MIAEQRTVYVSRGRYGVKRAHLSRPSALRREAKAAVWHVLVGRDEGDVAAAWEGDAFPESLIERMRALYPRALRLRVYLDRRARAARAA